jgi:RNA polymerase sigma-70 factor (ECF subfamily)
MFGLRSTALPCSDRNTRVRALVDEHVHFVARTLRSAGVPPCDLDDEIQRTLMVAANRIDDLQVGSERSFLFQVAHNVASHARRKIARRREILDSEPPERIESVATPEFLADRKQMRQLLDEVISALSESLRVVFTLFEFEQISMTEISETLELPRGTVASRLRRARAQFRQHVAAIELGDALPDDAVARIPEPARLRRERKSTLQHAMLAAGLATRGTPSTHAKTLSVLGFAGASARP